LNFGQVALVTILPCAESTGSAQLLVWFGESWEFSTPKSGPSSEQLCLEIVQTFPGARVENLEASPSSLESVDEEKPESSGGKLLRVTIFWSGFRWLHTALPLLDHLVHGPQLLVSKHLQDG